MVAINRVAIVAIGDELLSGKTANTNATAIAKVLARIGATVEIIVTLPDDPAVLYDTIKAYLVKGAWVITTGGLGPTLDDHTREVAGKLFQKPLRFNQACFDSLISRFGPELSTLQDQATQLEGAHLFPNTVGTAFGFQLESPSLYPGATLIALPGPPQEMLPMVHTFVVPLFKSLGAMHTIELFLGGVFEHEVDPLLRDLKVLYPHCLFGIYPGIGVVTVRVRSEDKTALTTICQTLQSAFKESVFQGEEGSVEEYFFTLLRQKQLTCGTAESCTAGALSALITNVPGVSAIFKGGVVAYSNSIKETLLGVDQKLLTKYGAVSLEVTDAMAYGLQKLLKVDLAIAVSGILGPTGGSSEKPIGTVCYTIVCKDKKVSNMLHLVGARRELRERLSPLILRECCKLVSLL